MEWNVKNALNRDVERQHLNKILAEIRGAIDSIQSSTGGSAATGVKDAVGEMVDGNVEQGINVTYDLTTGTLNFVVNDFILRLAGDVEGSVTVHSLTNATMQTTIDPDLLGVEEAPLDGNAYWRVTGEWEQVPARLYTFANLKGTGFLAQGADSQGRTVYNFREFLAAAGELTVTNGDGSTGNPEYGLADLPDTGVGDPTVKLITRDSKGRLEGTENASTDNLPEGLSNLYFTEERAQDAVGSILEDTVDIELVYDDATPSITANIINPVLLGLASLSPTDGDILEYDGTASEWAVTKNPRELYLDGGNF